MVGPHFFLSIEVSSVPSLELTDLDADRQLLALEGVSLLVFTSEGCASCRWARRHLPRDGPAHRAPVLGGRRPQWRPGGTLRRLHLPALFMVRDGRFHGALNVPLHQEALRVRCWRGRPLYLRSCPDGFKAATDRRHRYGSHRRLLWIDAGACRSRRHFLLRSEFEAVNRAGLSLNSAVHGFRRLAPVQAYHSAQDMPPCDWLLVGAKTTGNDELAPLIRAAAARWCQGSAAAERSGRGGAAAAAAAGKPASAGRPLLHLCASRRTGRDRAPGPTAE